MNSIEALKQKIGTDDDNGILVLNKHNLTYLTGILGSSALLVSKEKKELQVEGVFIEIGSQPATSMVKNLVNFNKRDEIEVDFVATRCSFSHKIQF